MEECFTDWIWERKAGYKMINNVASSFQADDSLSCVSNCTVSPTCDSYNYRSSDKTCQLTECTPYRLVCHAGNVLVLLTRRASSTHMTLHSSSTRLTLSSTAPGTGTAQTSLQFSELSRNVSVACTVMRNIQDKIARAFLLSSCRLFHFFFLMCGIFTDLSGINIPE